MSDRVGGRLEWGTELGGGRLERGIELAVVIIWDRVRRVSRIGDKVGGVTNGG